MVIVQPSTQVSFQGYSTQANHQSMVVSKNDHVSSPVNQAEHNTVIPRNFTAADLAMMLQSKTMSESATKHITNTRIALHDSDSNDIKRVRASHILLESDEEAQILKEELLSGKIGFEEAAELYSGCPSKEKGGDLGFFNRRAMVKPFSDAAFDAKVNEIVGPVKTQFGYHLIKTTDKKA
jgi:parvulin-like peptidyl-prolyl isomerase